METGTRNLHTNRGQALAQTRAPQAPTTFHLAVRACESELCLSQIAPSSLAAPHQCWRPRTAELRVKDKPTAAYMKLGAIAQA